MEKLTNKIIKCLDGRERIFNSRTFMGQKSIEYRIWKDGKAYGKTNDFYKENYPKFITKEMLFGSESTNEEIINKEDIVNEIAQLEARIKKLKAKL